MGVLLDCMVENALDPVIVIDHESLMWAWNRPAEQVFGWSRQECIGESIADRIIPERFRDAHRQGMKRFLATGESSLLSRRLELTALRRSGKEFPVELTITPIPRGDDSYAFFAFIRDVSGRLQELEELRRQLELAHDQLRSTGGPRLG